MVHPCIVLASILVPVMCATNHLEESSHETM
jgi:hypothetical protein